MKTLYTAILSIVLLLNASSNLIAQDCFYFHEYQCKYPNSSYFYSGQSRGALFAYGMTSEFKIVTFTGEDYHISLCHQFKLKNVRMRLMEDNDERTLLYDNQDFKFQTEMNFTNNVARKIIIEISIPEDPTGKDKNNMYCLGILIHFRKTFQEQKNKIGF